MDEMKYKTYDIKSKNRQYNFIYLIAGLVVAAVFFYLYTNAQSDRKRALQSKEIAERERDTARAAIEILLKEQEAREKDREQLSTQLEKVKAELDEIKSRNSSATVNRSIDTLEQTIIKISEISGNVPDEKTSETNKGYVIRFYSYNPNPKVKQGMINMLRKEGFIVTEYPEWNERKSFFSTSPTVLYYDRRNADRAKKLAMGLTKNFRVKFQAREGAGLGVFEKDRPRTFIIHYLE